MEKSSRERDPAVSRQMGRETRWNFSGNWQFSGKLLPVGENGHITWALLGIPRPIAFSTLTTPYPSIYEKNATFTFPYMDTTAWQAE